MKTRLYALLLVAACQSKSPATFVLPRHAEDLRAQLLAAIPEGRDIAGARDFMAAHGFTCEPAMPSDSEAHAIPCGADAAHADAGFARWSVMLIERNGRFADAQAR